MSCYFRRIKSVLAEAGIEATPASKRQIDQAIHRLMGVDYKDCPATWKKLKQEILPDEQKRRNFINQLKDAIS